jgi:hypothetical protein
MQSGEQRTDKKRVNLCDFKERLRAKLPPESPVLLDLLLEPDSMPIEKVEVLIPHYLQRLERELEKETTPGLPVLRA